MKIINKIVISIFCLSLFFVSTPVFAEDDEVVQTEDLLEQAMNLDPDSTESVEAFSRSLNAWDNNLSSELEQILGNVNVNQANIQFIFAQLQLQQSQICKTEAQDYINKIQDTQNAQKEVATLIDQLYALENNIRSTNVAQVLPNDVKEKLIKYEVYDLNNEKLTKALSANEVADVIDATRVKQESLSAATQTNMTYLQDFMGQYNQIFQQTATAMQAAESEASTVGGTMLSGSIGMFFTGILIGVFATVVVVLLIQKSRKESL